MNIIFFGNPQIAAEILEYIHKNKKHNILAVVTNPDKPQKRGLKFIPTPVKQYAEKNGIEILTTENLKDEKFFNNLKNFQADLFVVFAFRKLPGKIWKLPPKGTINLHASYLPDYRGAAPINWAIINGEEYSGVSTFFINDKIDTGDIILRKKISIDFKDTASDLTLKIISEGKKLLCETLDLIEKGKAKPIPQNQLSNIIPKKAPKITKEMCKIDWNKSAIKVYNFIRGLSEKPTAWTFLNKKEKKIRLKIYFADIQIIDNQVIDKPQIVFDKKNFIVKLSGGNLFIKDLQLENRKRMDVVSFLRGFDLKNCFFE